MLFSSVLAKGTVRKGIRRKHNQEARRDFANWDLLCARREQGEQHRSLRLCDVTIQGLADST